MYVFEKPTPPSHPQVLDLQVLDQPKICRCSEVGTGLFSQEWYVFYKGRGEWTLSTGHWLQATGFLWQDNGDLLLLVTLSIIFPILGSQGQYNTHNDTSYIISKYTWFYNLSNLLFFSLWCVVYPSITDSSRLGDGYKCHWTGSS